jgi:hypothetical protein
MAIRFCCPSCRKPLEVDTQLAGKEVLCFYCHDKAAVPTESDPSLGVPGPEEQGQALPPVPGKSPVLGYVGLFASIALIVCFFLLMTRGLGELVAVGRTPDFAKLSKKQQDQVVQDKILEIRKQPIMIFGYYAIIFFTLLGLGFSIVGIVANRGKVPAVFGLIISGVMALIQIYGFIQAIGKTLS